MVVVFSSLLVIYLFLLAFASDVQDFNKGFSMPVKALVYDVGAMAGLIFWNSYLSTSALGMNALDASFISIILILAGCLVGAWWENRGNGGFIIGY